MQKGKETTKLMNNFAKCVKKKHLSEASHTDLFFPTGNFLFFLDEKRKRFHKFTHITIAVISFMCARRF